jgi:hypothetical protein
LASSVIIASGRSPTMKTPTAHPTLRRRTFAADLEPLRFRAQLPALIAPLPPAAATTAGHDFLVPNLRPDLTTDLHTLRMLEAG